MLLNTNEFDKVVGEIYKITNVITSKSYIGQTRSHRLNHGKYRPFGYIGRLKDHICEAHSQKKNQSRYLNSSILKHGDDSFTCELILTCKLEELDDCETHYISHYNTMYPNGYNLTRGGQGSGFSKGSKIVLDETELVTAPIKERVFPKRSDYTKNLISERLIESKSDPEHRNNMMIRTQKQHLRNKFERFKNVTIDLSDIEKYIRVIHNNAQDVDYIRIVIENIRTNFVGKFETIEEIKERARHFIRELTIWQNSLMRETP